MRIVRPDNEAHSIASAAKMGRQRVERFHHVRVAKIPRTHFGAEHGPIVFFGIPHEPGVLLGDKLSVRPIASSNGVKPASLGSNHKA